MILSLFLCWVPWICFRIIIILLCFSCFLFSLRTYIHTKRMYVVDDCLVVAWVSRLARWLVGCYDSLSVRPSFLLYVCLFSQFILKLVVRHIEIFYVWALIEITIYVYGSLIVCCESFKQRRFKICYSFYKMGAVNTIFYLFLSLRLQI